MKKYGFTRFYTQAAKGSAEPAIEGTTGGVNPHHHHLHADVNDIGGTIETSTYKPAIQKQNSQNIQRQQNVQQNNTTSPKPTTKPKEKSWGEWWNDILREIGTPENWY